MFSPYSTKPKRKKYWVSTEGKFGILLFFFLFLSFSFFFLFFFFLKLFYSGRCPKALSIEKLRELGITGEIPKFSAHTVTVPG